MEKPSESLFDSSNIEKVCTKSILRQKTNNSEGEACEVNINCNFVRQGSKKISFADKKRKPLCEVFRFPSLLRKDQLAKVGKNKTKGCKCTIF